MFKQLPRNELAEVATKVHNDYFLPSSENKTTIFLCGADRTDHSAGRYKMANLLKTKKNYEILYPEDLFEDLMFGQGQHNLLDLENILADSVDCIILLPESPGSFTELGAFTSNPRLANKMICIIQKKYAKNKSFINYGPAKILKTSDTGKVLNITYNELASDTKSDKHYKKIRNTISAIKKNNPIKRDLTNILEIENLILPCIYLFDSIEISDIEYIVTVTAKKDKKISDIATRASLSRLIEKKFIHKISEGYSITPQGINEIKSSRRPDAALDKIRVKIIRSQYRNR